MARNNQYDDIINLPHHVSSTRPQMSMADRAAQFSPFAALTGHDAAIKEKARLTIARIDMDEDALIALNMKFQLLVDSLDDEPEISITYFKPDERKDGGAYLEATGVLKKLDEYERMIVLTDGRKIKMDDILDIEGDIFACLP